MRWKKKNKGIRGILFIFLVFLVHFSVIKRAEGSEISPGSPFGNNMVLQRETSVPFWGEGSPGTKIIVLTSWNQERYETTTDDSGRWEVVLKTGCAGGPYRITLQSPDTVLVLKDILLGEVWICSGQSNMEMPMQGFAGQDVSGANNEIALATNYPEIRLLQVERNISNVPAEKCNAEWRKSSSKTVAEFSAVGWFFGTFLYRTLHVPIGLIQSTWGGTPIELWTGEEVIGKFPDIDQHKALVTSGTFGPLKPEVLFNAMIHPLIPYRIKGVIWYQGESNIKEPERYSLLFPAMIEEWRQQWGYNFPFYYVQIAPCVWGGDNPRQSALLREAQLSIMLHVSKTGMAVTLDIGDSLRIHPARKNEVGQRLAYWALAKDYGFGGLGYTSPVYRSMSVKDTLALIYFDQLGNGLLERTVEELKACFEIAGKDRIFYPASAQIMEWKDFVEVWSDKVRKPVAVRYCFKQWCMGKLFGTNGLPVSSFRTDQWEIPGKEK